MHGPVFGFAHVVPGEMDPDFAETSSVEGFPHGPDHHPHRTTANPSAHRKGSERKSAHQDDRQDDHAPRHHIAVTMAAATTHAVRMVVGSRASPVAVNGASGKGITKAAAPLPVG